MSDTNALHSRSSSRNLAHFRQDTTSQETALMPIDREQGIDGCSVWYAKFLDCATIGRSFVTKIFMNGTEPVSHAGEGEVITDILVAGWWFWSMIAVSLDTC
jgi:hypothetical protein